MVLKRGVFACVTVALSCLICELLTHGVYWMVMRHPYPFTDVNAALDRVAQMSPDDFPTKPDASPSKMVDSKGWNTSGGVVEVIHPYLGFVHDPHRSGNRNDMGFFGRKIDLLHRVRPSAVTIYIMGGSFAAGVNLSGQNVITDVMKDHGIDADLHSVALGGYKQPQQVMSLVYLLTHDAPIDVVINVDGFNEVALPTAENMPKGVNLYFPRAWSQRVLGIYDSEMLRLIGKGTIALDCRRDWAVFFRRFPRFSIIRCFTWQQVDAVYQRRIFDLQHAMMEENSQVAQRYITTGPTMDPLPSDLYPTLAHHWATCSLLMQSLCDARGIRYFHALQPNQYYEPGRVLTDTERAIAFTATHPYRPGVQQGYPCLVAEGKKLRESGVDYLDLTMAYRDIPEPIYMDDCCHPNRYGYEIIARIIAEHVAESLVSDPDFADRINVSNPGSSDDSRRDGWRQEHMVHQPEAVSLP
ncbi:SGNH/GDSL hydrolase family protein [bacterium]|nr:SGNH/GDSL hydrolase family protein [candidate division CSSED10-310 bacterium]